MNVAHASVSLSAWTKRKKAKFHCYKNKNMTYINNEAMDKRHQIIHSLFTWNNRKKGTNIEKNKGQS
jgi:hypothetical protein